MIHSLKDAIEFLLRARKLPSVVIPSERKDPYIDEALKRSNEGKRRFHVEVNTDGTRTVRALSGHSLDCLYKILGKKPNNKDLLRDAYTKTWLSAHGTLITPENVGERIPSGKVFHRTNPVVRRLINDGGLRVFRRMVHAGLVPDCVWTTGANGMTAQRSDRSCLFSVDVKAYVAAGGVAVLCDNGVVLMADVPPTYVTWLGNDKSSVEIDSLVELKNADLAGKVRAKVLDGRDLPIEVKLYLSLKTDQILFQVSTARCKDADLVSTNFPHRGCVGYVEDDGTVVVSGFYPKFANDAKSHVPDGLDAVFSIKYSGSLLMASLYRHNGKIYVSTWAKNTRAKDIAEYFEPMVFDALSQLEVDAPDVLQDLFGDSDSDYAVVSFEALKMGDRAHGYVSLKDVLVLTGLHRPGTGFASSDEVQTIGRKIEDVLVKHGCYVFPTPCVSVASSDVAGVLEKLSGIRNGRIVSAKMLWELLGVKAPGEVARVKRLHDDLVGGVVEGFVVRFANGHVLKWKVPAYVLRTMCLRTLMELRRKGKPVNAFDVRRVAWSVLLTFGAWDHAGSVKRFNELAHLVDVTVSAWLRFNFDDPSLDHVSAWEAATAKGVPAPRSLPYIHAGLHLVIGPIGSGKSTFAAQLADRLGVPHIDGDEMLGVFANAGHARARTLWFTALLSMVGYNAAVVSLGGQIAGVHDGVARMLASGFLPRVHVHSSFGEGGVPRETCDAAVAARGASFGLSPEEAWDKSEANRALAESVIAGIPDVSFHPWNRDSCVACHVDATCLAASLVDAEPKFLLGAREYLYLSLSDNRHVTIRHGNNGEETDSFTPEQARALLGSASDLPEGSTITGTMYQSVAGTAVRFDADIWDRFGVRNPHATIRVNEGYAAADHHRDKYIGEPVNGGSVEKTYRTGRFVLSVPR